MSKKKKQKFTKINPQVLLDMATKPDGESVPEDNSPTAVPAPIIKVTHNEVRDAKGFIRLLSKAVFDRLIADAQEKSDRYAEARVKAAKIAGTEFDGYKDIKDVKDFDILYKLDSAVIRAAAGEYNELADMDIEDDTHVMETLRSWVEWAKDEKTSLDELGLHEIKNMTCETVSDVVVMELLQVGKSLFDYNAPREFISDELYDNVRSVWTELFAEPSGITPSIGGKVKLEPKYPELSNNLNKAYRILKTDENPSMVKAKQSVEGFLEKAFAMLEKGKKYITLSLSPKVDGVSVNCVIDKDGIIHHVCSRAGSDGKSIQVKGLEEFKLCTSGLSDISLIDAGVQFEMFATRGKVETLALLNGTAYATCRSAASGVINRMMEKPDNFTQAEHMWFYPIAAKSERIDNMPFADYIKAVESCAKVPSDTPERKTIRGDIYSLMEKIEDYYTEMMNIRENLSFDIDGVVITVIDKNLQKGFSRNNQTNGWQLALKFPPETGDGIADSVSVSTVAKKGSRTIMVKLKDTVTIGGADYTEIQWLSAKTYDALNLRKGSKLRIIRTGDVIPTFEVKDPGNGKKLPMPSTCPSCGGKLEMSGRTGRLTCTNVECPANIAGKIVNLLTVLGIDKYSDKFAAHLVEGCDVKNLEDLLQLKDSDLTDAGLRSKLAGGFVSTLHNAIESAADYTIIEGLGLPSIGSETAFKIAKMIPIDKLADMNVTEITSALSAKESGIGKKTVQLIAPQLAKSSKLIKLILNENTNTTNTKTVKTIGETGFRMPNDMVKSLEEQGYRVSFTTKVFDALVVPKPVYKPDMSWAVIPSGKLLTAHNKHLPIIVYRDLIDLVKSNTVEDIFTGDARMPIDFGDFIDEPTVTPPDIEVIALPPVTPQPIDQTDTDNEKVDFNEDEFILKLANFIKGQIDSEITKVVSSKNISDVLTQDEVKNIFDEVLSVCFQIENIPCADKSYSGDKIIDTIASYAVKQAVIAGKAVKSRGKTMNDDKLNTYATNIFVNSTANLETLIQDKLAELVLKKCNETEEVEDEDILVDLKNDGPKERFSKAKKLAKKYNVLFDEFIALFTDHKSDIPEYILLNSFIDYLERHGVKAIK